MRRKASSDPREGAEADVEDEELKKMRDALEVAERALRDQESYAERALAAEKASAATAVPQRT